MKARVGWIIVGLFVAPLVLSEAILTLLHKRAPVALDHPPLTTQSVRLKVFAPNVDLWVSPTPQYREGTDALPAGPYQVRTDSHGFIKSNTVFEQAEKTIVFAGGSTTECLYVDEDKRFPSLVATLLEEKAQWKANVLNAGVSGANTLHVINTTINKVLPLKPNIIVLMENINDLATQAHLGGYWNSHKTRSQLQIPVSAPTGTRAALTHFLPEISAFLYGKQDFNDEFKEERLKAIVPNISAWSQEFEMNLRTFIEICQARNITPVLMTQPNRFTPSPDPLILNLAARWTTSSFPYSEFLRAYNAMNQTVTRVANQKKVVLIDLDQKIPKTKEFIYDSVHLNSTGSILAAEIISEELKKLKH